jgi:hypothetical protein
MLLGEPLPIPGRDLEIHNGPVGLSHSTARGNDPIVEVNIVRQARIVVGKGREVHDPHRQTGAGTEEKRLSRRTEWKPEKVVPPKGL